MLQLLYWPFTIVGGILIVAGIVTLLVSLRHFMEVAGSKSWPSTPGKVVSSDVRMVTRTVKFGDEPEREVLEHKVEVRYEYKVKSTVFSGIDVGESATQSNSEAWAQARAAQFPVGRELPVYYSPKDPTRSMLEPGAKPLTYIPIGVALALIGVGLAMVLISRAWAADG